MQGSVEHRRADNPSWVVAGTGEQLCSGDTLRVGQLSRAALLLPNETTLRLDQDTTLTLSAPDQARGPLLDLIRGVINVISRTPRPFRVNTPFLNANVEGTEFLVGSTDTGARVAVFEGKVSAGSGTDSLMLVGGEIAYVSKGAPLRKERMLRPADAVQWALYYPTIFDYRLGEGIGGAAGEDAVRKSVDLYRQNRLAEAIVVLGNVPQGAASTRFLTYRAGLLLQVGRADEAKSEIDQALSLEPDNSDAYALQAVVAVVQNDKDRALVLASRAVELDPTSPKARISLSYAQQAHFKIEEALASVQKAVELDPQNALAWARLAELHMSTGYLDRALEAAQRAVSLSPDIAKTQSVLGFANLTRIDTKAAKQAFEQAISLDQADPLPRLGLGLAKIRDGDLTSGREEIEIAVSLDPENSLMRSYLGKAYYEEKRDKLAGTQFELAKERDPNDPTPWFYDATRKQAGNRPVEALEDLQKSIELNDNRAVYRSRLFLDEDRASRNVSVAQIYRDLGFDELAAIEAANSLASDSGNYSALRFLSDAYSRLPRHEIARSSTLLQSQLLQPLSLIQAQPQLPFADVSMVTAVPFSQAAFNEYSLLFEGDGSRYSFAGQVGNNGTKGDEFVASILKDGVSLSLGQFHYETDGFRKNSDITHDIYSAFLQLALSSSFNVQAEIRQRKTEHGDLAFNFDANDFSANNRFDINQTVMRFGAIYQPTPTVRLIGSFMDNDRDESQKLFEPGVAAKLKDEFPGNQSEVQLQRLFGFGNFTAGLGTSRAKSDIRVTLFDPAGILGGICPPEAPCKRTTRTRQDNGYVYTNIAARPNLTATIGLSHDTFDNGQVDLQLWNPKFGINWRATNWLGLRAAAFKALKRTLIVDQTIEPTQIAGFNQFFDDFNGTKTTTVAGAVDLPISPTFRATIEAFRRDLCLDPGIVIGEASAGPDEEEEWHERTFTAGLVWLPTPQTAVALRYEDEHFKRSPIIPDAPPISVSTKTVPLVLRHFWRQLFTQVGATFVKQQVKWPSTSSDTSGRDSFTLYDFALGYRLPKRNDSVTLVVKNLLDEHFSYQDEVFRTNEPRLPRYLPERSIVFTLSLSF